MEVSAPCYQTATFTVTTRPGVGTRHDVVLQPQVVAPVAFDQYILSGMQTNVVALSQNEVWWYDSDTAATPIAVGSFITTPVLFDTTTYYLEEHYQNDTLLCVSPRSSVTVYVIDTSTLAIPNSPLAALCSLLTVYPNPAGDYLMLETEGDGAFMVEIYDVKGTLVAKETCGSPAQLNISQFTPGLYFLKVINRAGHPSIAKFVKK